VDVSWARIFQFVSKLAEARQRVVHVAPSQRSREDQAKDRQVDAMGCVGPYYSCFIIFIVLGPSDILVVLVFYLDYK
jgi:hypothetical protein